MTETTAAEGRVLRLLDLLDAIVLQLDAATLRPVFVGGRAESLLGYPLDRWYREPGIVEPLLHPDDRANVLALLAGAAADGRERRVVFRAVAADGHAVWFQAAIEPVDLPDGRQLVALLLDVTERVRAEEAIERTAADERLLLEQIPVIVWTTDRELRFTSGAGSALGPLGLRPDQMVGVPVAAYFQTGDPNHPFVLAHRRAVEGEQVAFDAEWLGRIFQITIHPFHDAQQQVIGSVGVALDITERKRTELDLQRERDFKSALVDTLDALVLVLDRDGHLVLFNKACERVTGYRADEALGKNPAELFVPPEHRPRVEAALTDLFAGRAPSFGENPWMTRSGERRLIAFSNTVLRDAEGRVEFVIASGIDVTDQRRTEEQLRHSEARLRLLVEQLPIIIWTTDRELRFTFSTLRGLGLEPERTHELERLSIDEFFAGEKHADLVVDAHRRALAGSAVDYEAEWGGRLFRARIEPFLDASGAVVGVIGVGSDITESRQAEETLSRERDFRSAIVETVGSLVVVLDRAGHIALFNRSAEQTTGYSAEDVRGRYYFELLVPFEWRQEARRRVDRIFLGNYPIEAETVWLTRDGSRRHIALSDSGLAGPQGGIEFAIVTGLDITERKRAEVALLESKRRYEDLVNAVDGVVWEADATLRRFTFASRQAERILGFPVSQWLEPAFLEAHAHPDDRDLIGRIFATPQTEAGGSHEVELRLFAADGRVVWMRCLVSPRLSETKVRGVMLDITRRTLEAEERARLLEAERLARTAAVEAERRTAFLAEASRILAGSLDYTLTLEQVARLALPSFADWCIVDVIEDGEQARRVAVEHVDPERAGLARQLRDRYPLQLDWPLGITEVLRRRWPMLVAEVTDEFLKGIARTEEHLRLLRALSAASAIGAPLVARGRLLGVITLVYGPSGRRYDERDLALVSDLASRAALAVDNARLYHEAQQAIRARDEFLSIASHELRTPCTSLQLGVQSLLRLSEKDRLAMAPPGLVRSMLETSERQSKRLAQLVDKLLDVSRITAGRLQLDLEQVDLGAVAAEVVAGFREEQLRSGSTLTVESEQQVVGWWDRSRLAQIVTNLVSNAIKYGAGKPIRVSVERRGGDALLEVEDHGIGIPRDRQPQIFKQFERAVSSKYYGGLGLGLYIVREITLALGGEIEFESEPGVGTLFRVRLPMNGPGGGGEELRPEAGAPA